MNIDERHTELAVRRTLELCRIPSPTGFTRDAAELVEKALRADGIAPRRTNKGSVFCDLGGSGRPLVLAAHLDTLGAIVRSVKPNGRLRFSHLGSFPDLSILTETCIVHARDGRRFTGTFQPVDASLHVNTKLREMKFDDQTVEILLDERVAKREDVTALGISAGDIVSIDARPLLTETGFIKSRHLDDKASAGILLSIAAAAASGALSLGRKTWLLFTTYEEVGHGGAVIPEGVEEFLSVDMGAVGDDLGCDEYKVSICAKDSNGPYDWDVTNALIEAAKRALCDYAVDIYPSYGSDADVALFAGHDVRHGLIGPGVYASHGYERTHRDALANTLALIFAYLSP
ncbi:MAG TPA: M42 family metallopeptidase [Rectinemataceae bacterium]|nr:M42 family metallopeptidase [Rectinemataceae bacterium]